MVRPSSPDGRRYAGYPAGDVALPEIRRDDVIDVEWIDGSAQAVLAHVIGPQPHGASDETSVWIVALLAF